MGPFHPFGFNIINLDEVKTITTQKFTGIDEEVVCVINNETPVKMEGYWSFEQMQDFIGVLNARAAERDGSPAELKTKVADLERRLSWLEGKMGCIWNMPGAPGYEESRASFSASVGTQNVPMQNCVEQAIPEDDESNFFQLNDKLSIELPSYQDQTALLEDLSDALNARLLEKESSSIEMMKRKIAELEKRMECLWYMPGAPGYEEARGSFATATVNQQAEAQVHIEEATNGTRSQPPIAARTLNQTSTAGGHETPDMMR
ncbi:uncharacterized protein EV422DRAFT_621005 [Fimicolochytrium jonesii]|uniref:uncharacterized protein n=1 Tax=Fimicolochytrium jonesii TaxID=1396493 RepID=UPI0022FE8CEE|nr:uncharacterized protein EV422DRAFT_621005 [Fimicolochytrium jonesii]KAI8819713.1 hypothetical protein EV422DRAFT_621005 [Fimicolochytrium jonesii]